MFFVLRKGRVVFEGVEWIFQRKGRVGFLWRKGRVFFCKGMVG